MCLPSHYCACTYPRPTTLSSFLISPSKEIHEGVPYYSTPNDLVMVRGVSYDGGALGYVLVDLPKI